VDPREPIPFVAAKEFIKSMSIVCYALCYASQVPVSRFLLSECPVLIASAVWTQGINELSAEEE
jgi:hypothetical protein